MGDIAAKRHQRQADLPGAAHLFSAAHREGLIMSRSSTTTKEIPNPTPGEILLLDFIEPMGLTQNALARAIGVPPRRINEVVLGKRAMTADTDLRLARYFGLSDGFWLGLQSDHDLMRQRRKIAAELERIEPRSLAV
jgi:addiction module HigA family antidote